MDLQSYQIKYQNIYYDNTRVDVADSLAVAKLSGAKMYRGICDRHGPMVFWTVDNSCPVCCKIARDARHRDDATRGFNISRMRYNEIKRRGTTKGVPVNLSLNEFRQIYDNAPSVCPVLGIPMAACRDAHEDGSASVDRLVPEIGYTTDNIRIISNKANRIKNEGSVEDHLRVASWVWLEQGGDPTELHKVLHHIIDQLVGGLA